MQTAETAMLFLQLIMRKLKRPGNGSDNGGRATVVVHQMARYSVMKLLMLALKKSC